MISPAFTTWPPKRLTPSRCELESRPLRELEAPFLCAIGSLPVLLDSGDLDDRQRLTVALALVVAGLVLELVDADLRPLGLLEDLTGDGDLRQRVGIRRHVRAVDHQGDGQRNRRAGLGLDLLDLDYVADRDLVLLAAGLDDCVSRHRVLFLCFAMQARVTRRSRALVLGAGRMGPLSPPVDHRAWRQLVKVT